MDAVYVHLFTVSLCRGHGTYLVEGELRASVAGVVEMVNKLIYVQPMKSRCSIDFISESVVSTLFTL